MRKAASAQSGDALSLPQRHLLVRAVHADARQGQPRQVMSVAAKLLAALAVVATLLVGVWFWSGVVAPGYWSTIVLGALWFVPAP